MENKIIQCPSCSKKMQIPPTFFGKKIKCPQCSSVLVIDAQGGVTLGAPVAPPPAPPQTAPAPPAPQQVQKAPTPVEAPQEAPAEPEAEAEIAPKAPAPAVAKPKKPKPDLRPKSAVSKPKAQLKKGTKVAGKASKGRLTISKVKKPKKKVSGIKLQKTEKKVGKDKLSAASRFERKKQASPLSKLGLGLGFIAVLAAVAYFLLGGEKRDTTPDLTPKNVLPEVEFKDQGEKEINTYNDKAGKVHFWKKVIKTEMAYPNMKPDQEQNFLSFSDEIDYVHIPAGEYTVGYNAEGGLIQNQSPEIKVKVNDFYMSTKEITIEQFRNFVKYIDTLKSWQDALVDEGEKYYFRNPKYSLERFRIAKSLDPTIFNHPDQPKDIIHRVDPIWENDPAVYQISWWSAYAYCAWANRLDPNKGNLPTEIEWEIAARGKEGYLYPWGNKADDLKTPGDADDKEILSKYGYYPGNTIPYNPNERIKKGDIKYHVPVNNSFGMYDMAGNVSEWCFDPFVTQLYVYLKDINSQNADGEEAPFSTIFYKGGASKEDQTKYGIQPGDKAVRINAGNLTLDKKAAFRFTYRNGSDVSNTSYSIGFRCVYYKDSPAPNADLLKELYERRKAMVDYEWEKLIANKMIKLAEDENNQDELTIAKKAKKDFEAKYKDMIAKDSEYGKEGVEDNGESKDTPTDDNKDVEQPDNNTDAENNGEPGEKPDDLDTPDSNE